MIYGNDFTGYGELTAELAAIGADSKTIDIMLNYLDTDKKRDDRLLKKIKCRSYYGGKEINNSKYRSAVKKCVADKQDDELTSRYICFMYALFGASCSEVLIYLSSSANAKDLYEKLRRGMVPCYGEKAAQLYALACACNYETVRLTIPKNDGLVAAQPAQKLAEAAEVIFPVNRFAGRLIAARALEKFDGTDVPSWVKGLCKLVLGNMPKQIPKEANDSTWLATFTVLAEGSFYSDKMKKLLCEYMKATDSYKFGPGYAVRKHCPKVLDAIEAIPDLVNGKFIRAVCEPYKGMDKIRLVHMEKLAREYTKLFTHNVKQAESLDTMMEMKNTLEKLGEPCYDIKPVARERGIEIITEIAGKKAPALTDFVSGRLNIEDVLEELSDLRIFDHRTRNYHYYKIFGADEFFARYFTVIMMGDSGYSKQWFVQGSTGLSLNDEPKEAVRLMLSTGLPVELMLKGIAEYADSYSSGLVVDNAAKALAAYPDKLIGIDVSKYSPTARLIAVKALAENAENFKSELMAMTDDTSKQVKAVLSYTFGLSSAFRDETIELLGAKKAAKRELAVSVIEKQGAQGYMDELKAAFEKEKSAKLKDKIAALIGAEVSQADMAKGAEAIDTVAELTKGAKLKKVQWVFDNSYAPLHYADGTEAEERYAAAICLCYANMTDFGISGTAKALTEKLVAKEVERFAKFVLTKWTELGAQAKQKWVLYFAAIHGGEDIIDHLMSCIKEWSDHSRGLIAAEAVRAMALSGSTTALINVDGLARKFRNKQVRKAANEALSDAADKLGLTTEELADKIVPDLGFDEKMCRVFDFGTRQFDVYLSGGDTLEIFCGEKQMKNLPRPGANDDKEKAEQAAAEFKELKKQLKTVAANQRARLEYVLMCDRKWSACGWKELFVKNAVMHGFATGLIWGIYSESGALQQTFRYMEDGSFNTADEEEFEIPKDASIGLVHPLELTEEELSAWKEQLEDYEITQPFPQLSRKVYRMTDAEKQSDAVTRFEGKTFNSLSLISKMTARGWYKGNAEDGGWFYFFYRSDLSRREKTPDGSYRSVGMRTELEFSGASIVAYDYEGEEVTLKKLKFYDPQHNPYSGEPMCIGEVSPRYYSEIMMQLTDFLGE
ncbi:MAG: DUF4132 domain-containing protein [Ruminococcus sp.]|nr:DUF4132 domain-containing protein [Ruminococcus sp.]